MSSTIKYGEFAKPGKWQKKEEKKWKFSLQSFNRERNEANSTWKSPNKNIYDINEYEENCQLYFKTEVSANIIKHLQ